MSVAVGPAGPIGPIGSQGPIGPQGPAGPSGLTAYGGRFSNTPQAIPLEESIAEQVALGGTMPALNESYVPANSITVAMAGSYQISFVIKAAASLAATVTAAPRLNGVYIPSLTVTSSLSAGTPSVFSASAIITLAAGDVIDLAVSSPSTVSLVFGTDVSASLNVSKVN